ncbi:Fis family transcriptional regulator [Turneriella parva]|uniref:Helix-turn-helix Fis-type n=1 Tax=Turneriella parva (strain ATCC BAA-1111 / DSM 21527 / NCTC 11395 / H) TaxID=869212 RepID=I4BC02_TURPD|nr:Fis family transcriptional regulator [Turneriella parva]AFM14809.1 helix-turn-helix Fis-type [Turneriella parva DSM 21527]
MQIWSEYQSRGLWGLWRAHFFAAGSGFEVALIFDGAERVVEVSEAAVAFRPAASLPQVFEWQSGNGLTVKLFAPSPVSDAAGAVWGLLLQLEKTGPEIRPTFFPFMPDAPGLAATLNAALLSPPPVLLLNGQPGVGKRFVLQSLALLHTGQLPDLNRSPVCQIEQADRTTWLVPEIALLELKEQQELWKNARSGDALRVASVYDVGMLSDRKIVHQSLAAMLEPQKLVMPALAKRDAAELQSLGQFWQAFYGPRSDAAANLAFLKKQVLGGAGLSVESILEEGRGLRGVVAEFEKEAIRRAHARVGRSQHKIARLLKVSRGSLQHKLRKYQLESYTSSDADNDE